MKDTDYTTPAWRIYHDLGAAARLIWRAACTVRRFYWRQIIGCILVAAILYVSGCQSQPMQEKWPTGMQIKLAGTGSMGHKFDGAVMFIEATPYDQLKVGDVVCYRPAYWTKSDSICHRLIEKRGKGFDAVFVARGDACKYRDPQYVTHSNYLGRVIWPK